MKKALTLILALALCACMAMPAFAADISYGGTDSGTAPVSYDVAPTYTVTIPTSISIDPNTKEGAAQVTATDVRLAENKQLAVKITGPFTLKTSVDASYSLPYSVKLGEAPVISGNEIGRFNSDADEPTREPINLTFKADTPKYAGNFTGTVTFTVSVEDPTP